MKYLFFDQKDKRGLINNMFTISFTTPSFKSIIIPTGFPAIAYIFGERQTVTHSNEATNLEKIIISGQYDSTFDFSVKFDGYNIGANLHPTALYKILGVDISLYTNKHLLLEKINKELFNILNPTFLNHKNDIEKLKNEFIEVINSLDLYIDKDVDKIDVAIEYILKKEGMLQVIDLLKVVTLSQKSLETKFKKIIGLTPGKYIRLTRFIKLMRKYECKEIDLNDLIYMYNYYDHSHFIKDFKLFMSESPKEYFKKEYPLIKAYSVKL